MDRKQTLLHYIVHVVELVYPNVLSFYEELNVVEACQGESRVMSNQVMLVLFVTYGMHHQHVYIFPPNYVCRYTLIF